MGRGPLLFWEAGGSRLKQNSWVWTGVPLWIGSSVLGGGVPDLKRVQSLA